MTRPKAGAARRLGESTIRSGASATMEFDWSPEDLQHRAEFRDFLREFLPPDWEKLSEGGPGSDVQADFSRRFCRALAASAVAAGVY